MNQQSPEVRQTFEDLMRILNTEVGVYEDLLLLMQRKQTAIIANDLDVLRDTIHKEHLILQRTENVGAQRELRVRAVAAMLNTMGSKPSLPELIEMAPAQYRPELFELHHRLKANVEQITLANKNNAFLLNSALELTRGMIKIFLKGDDSERSVYQGNGQTATNTTGQSMVDCQI
jgi:flagellar biosynthesis/type III secretory pathway chaperone